MELNEYLARFDAVRDGEITGGLYADPHYVEYTKLNDARQRRWTKKMELEPATKEVMRAIDQAQHWIVITEEWCGDSAHSLPFIAAMVKENPLVTLEIQLRDAPPFQIEQYLTNGGKSIPILIARDMEGKDLFVWGPRPEGGKKIMLEGKAQGQKSDITKAQLHKWYNDDKGIAIQQEIRQQVEQVVKASAKV